MSSFATGVLASEWTKLRSVRSTYWTLAIALVAAVGIAGLASAELVHNFRDFVAKGNLEGGFDATNYSLNGLYLAQIAVGALGVLTVTGEYATGMIRTTLTAVPQRRAVLAAKAAVFGGVVLVLGEVMSFAAFGVAQAILATKHVGASLGEPGVLRAVIGGGLYLTVVGLLAVGLGAALRRTAGALSAFFGILFATSVVVDLLPTSWRNTVIPYLPANAGSQILVVHRGHDALAPWTGLGVLSLYAVAALVLAAVVISARDV